MTSCDLRFAVRRLHRHLSASLAAVLTLALGVGAVTALFSVVQSVLLRPPPFRTPDELVAVGLHPRGQAENRLEISYPDFRDWRAHSRSFQDLAAHQTAAGRVVWESGGEPQPALRGRAARPADLRRGRRRARHGGGDGGVSARLAGEPAGRGRRAQGRLGRPRVAIALTRLAPVRSLKRCRK